MQALTDTLLPIVNTINGYLSDYILVFLLMGAGLYFSFKTKFVQVRCFGEGMKRVFGNLTLSGKKHESGMSSFQALATAIAAQVGTGNIVGASGAILTAGGHLLDVDHRVLRYGDHLCRGSFSPEDTCEK